MSKITNQEHIPAWPPIWRNRNEYRSLPDPVHKFRWAWQFLRRNQEYQNDYERWVIADNSDNSKEAPKLLILAKKKYYLNTEGVPKMLDPAEYWPEEVSFSQMGRGPIRIVAGVPNYEGRVLISFDASINFDRQIEKAKRLFEQAIPSKAGASRLNPDDLRKYLQIYDALQDPNASRNEILKTIYGGTDEPGTSAISEAYRVNRKKAEDLVDDLGYITKILMTP